MSTVNGFQVGSETLKYNYESLENYNTPNFSTSSSKTYAVGDYVMYNGKLYKCTTATTGGTWVSGSWETAILTDDVNEINGEVSDLSNAINDSLIVKVTPDADIWADGYWAIADGTIAGSGTWARSAQIIDKTIASIVALSPYVLYVLAYDGDTYIGTWTGNGFTKTFDSSYICRYIDIASLRNIYPSYDFHLNVAKKASGPVTINDVLQNVSLYQSVTKWQNIKIKNIYGDIVNSDYWENGTISRDGKKSASNSIFWNRLSSAFYLRFVVPVTIVPKNGYLLSVTAYSKDGTFESQSAEWISNPYTLSCVDKLYKIVIKAANDSNVLATAIQDYIDSYALLSTPFNRILSEYANVKAVNHRGYNTIAPENTLPAYSLSAEYGYKYVETDVLFTHDGVPVLMHDDTINRTCCNASDGSAISGSVSIESIDYDDLISNYDACSSSQWAKWKGVKVPTFAEFMKCCRALNLHPWIELKLTHTYTQAEVQQIISIIKQCGMEEHVSFISFSYAALALVAAEWDTVELGLNGSVSDAEQLKTGKNRVFMIYNYHADYSAAVNAGFQICFYTVDTEAVLSSINTFAYDSVLTNALLPSQVCDVVKDKYIKSV